MIIAIFSIACGPRSDGTENRLSPAQLSALDVGSLSLSPAFAPDIYDYVVRCAPGPNTLSVRMVAAGPGQAGLTQPLVSALAHSQTVSLDLSEDQAAVVQVTAPDVAPSEYWIRCLPADFPALTILPHPEAGQPSSGWYLMGSAILPAGVGGFAMILDNNGTPVWYQRATTGVFDVKYLDTNTVAYFAEGGYQIRHLETAQMEWVHAVGLDTDVHELQRLPNGNHLLLSYPLVDNIDLSGLRDFGTARTVVDCVVQEVNAAGEAVWQWRASEHISPVLESTYPTQYAREGRDVVDVYHCNAIDVDAGGDLLLSARHLDAVFLISKQSGRVLWKLGGSGTSTEGAPMFTIEGGAAAAFYRQHDARFLPGGGLSLFDDHTGQPGVARGAEYQLDFEHHVARLTDQYPGPLPSTAMGSYRRNGDGTRLVGWGLPNPGSELVFSEFAADGRLLFDVAMGPGSHSYRAIKAPANAFDLPTLRRATAAK